MFIRWSFISVFVILGALEFSQQVFAEGVEHQSSVCNWTLDSQDIDSDFDGDVILRVSTNAPLRGVESKPNSVEFAPFPLPPQVRYHIRAPPWQV